MLMEAARKMSVAHKKVFKQRQRDLEEERMRSQKERVQRKQESEHKLLLQKEKITSDIVHLGLWISKE